MIRSLRFRILAWYVLSLLLTVGCFGGFLYWRMRESKISEMDLELRGAGQTLVAALNAFPPWDFQWDKPLGTIPDPRDFPEYGPPGGRGGGGERRGGRGRGFGRPEFGGPGFGGPGPEDQGMGTPSANESPTSERKPLKPRPDLEKAPESQPASKNPVLNSADDALKTSDAKPPTQEGPAPWNEEMRRDRGGRSGPGGGPGSFGPGDHFHDDRGPGGRGFGGRGGPGGPPMGGPPPGEFGFRGDGPGEPFRDGPPQGLKDEIARKVANLSLPTNFERNVEATEGEKPFYSVWRQNGSVMKATSEHTPQGLHVAKTLHVNSDGIIRSAGEYREIWLAGPHDSVILVRRKAGKLYADLSMWLWRIIGTGVGVLAFGVAGGWWMSYGVLNSIRAMNSEVSRLSEKNLSQRVSLKGVDVELKNFGLTLNRALAKLEAAFDRQRQFTGDASHELRTPLTVVMGNLELALQDAKLGPDAKRSLEAALRAAKRMRGLTDQLLMLARADAGALELRRSEFDLGDIVQECAELVRPMADKKQVHIEVNAPSTEIEGDAGLLSQVVINLLSNAIQYNKSGGEVHIGLSSEGNSVALQVSDTGVGIPEESRARLFERFYRPDGSRNRQSGGNGLGLAISKSLVEAHGGNITFASAVGTGTEFKVLLPRC